MHQDALTSSAPSPLQLQQSSEPLTLLRSASLIALISAAAFALAAQLSRTQVFSLCLCAASAAPDLSSIPEEYHEFTEVFSDVRADTLPKHRPFDLKINLEDGQVSSPSLMYSLSPLKLQALQDFLKENLSFEFIRQSTSPHGTLMVFTKKKDGTLHFCVNYHALN